VPEPALGALTPRGRAWEMTRYQAYQAQLAGCTVGEIFAQAVAFLGTAVQGVDPGGQCAEAQGRGAESQ
jgi:hypothetical protein